MKKLIINGLLIALFVALYRAIKASIEPETWNNFWDFMFADYIRVWNLHFADSLPSITHPVVMIIIAIFALLFITRRMR